MKVIFKHRDSVTWRLEFTKLLLERNVERHNAKLLLYRVLDNNDVADKPLEIEVMITAIEALSNELFNGEAKEVKMIFCDSFADEAGKSLEGPNPSCFDSQGEIILTGNGSFIGLPFRMSNLRLMASARLSLSEQKVTVDVVQVPNEVSNKDNECGSLRLEADTEELLFRTI